MKKIIPFILFFLCFRIYAAGTYFTGDGARNTRLAVAAPAGKGLAADEAWLPLYVQGMLTGNFNKYSAMTIIDRQNMDKVLDEQELSLSGLYSNDDFIRIGNLTNAQYILAGSIEKTQGEQFSVQWSITTLDTGAVRAAFSKICTATELRGGRVINEASADLLAKMGVQLTEAGKRELQATSAADIDAQTALAKGISAQRSGSAVEALSYFYQASAVDPTLKETAGRLNSLSSRISGGNLGQNVRNALAARNSWFAMLKDCAVFYKTHMPFDIVYDPVLRQIGDTDYANATADFSFTVELPPAEVAFKVINDLITGLEATGQRSTWDFAGWPLINGSKYPEPDTVVFEGKRVFSFNVTAAVIDGRGRTIGTDTITLTSGYIGFTIGDKMIHLPTKASTEARFYKVNIADYVPPLTVKILSVNNITAETANATGYMRVLTQAEHYNLPEHVAKRAEAARQAEAQRRQQEDTLLAQLFEFRGNTITRYKGSEKNVTIPSRFTAIGNRAFGSRGLTSVIIPNSITSIGENAFSNNQLTSVVIPNSITSIGENAFSNNQLTSVVIPNSVTSIGDSVFQHNQLTSVVIPNSVTSIGENAFSNNQLTSVVIPNSVTSIGVLAFFNNRLTSVVIPNGVTSIGEGAFQYNPSFTSITIGENVALGNLGFPDNFVRFYESQRKRAGTYTWDGKKWSRQ
ncbi:hypothetical protein FACS189479_03790 [Spirochaetia bacterium]|nr:hypothetical protein FACS189479_03790 [Spirochaetia bacterium]